MAIKFAYYYYGFVLQLSLLAALIIPLRAAFLSFPVIPACSIMDTSPPPPLSPLYSAVVTSTLAGMDEIQGEESSTTPPPSLSLSLRRRQTLLSIPFMVFTSITATAMSSNIPVAHATTAPSAMLGLTPEEKQRIAIGYKQVEYLLNNFDQETTVCRDNGGQCKRDADAIRRALGLRSTTDPLFQVDKVLAKVKNLDLDPDQLEAFFEASEEFNSALNMSNSMAFVSQFGEYNPGGGQDEVLKYLNESKKQVIIVQKALKVIMEILDIPPVA